MPLKSTICQFPECATNEYAKGYCVKHYRRQLRNGDASVDLRKQGRPHTDQSRLAIAAAHRTHGYARTPTYRAWANIKTRTSNPHYSSYHRYGGRGITMCDRWKVFENFLLDMGEKPPGMWIERINNDGNYEPSNCKWATPKEQALNRSS